MNSYQRVWAEINLDNLSSNMAQIRQMINKNTKIMAVVKADGYGHGAVEAAKAFLYNGADCLGVAICDEGISLRQNNIHVSILILGNTPTPKLHEVVKHNIAQTVFNIEMCQELSEISVRLKKKTEVHIKIDTGMGRLGFLSNDRAFLDILKISNLPGINIGGIYTHFADSTNPNENFTDQQFEKFNNFVFALETKGLYFPVKHAANSGAIISNEKYNMDMVRPGIISYGLSPFDAGKKLPINIKPAMSLKTTVSHVKEIDPNASIGYGRTFFTKRNTIVATIPVGYADGYLRTMGNKSRVLIKGQFAPVIGGICMDQFMVDVTDIESVSKGDEVVLMGSQDKDIISAEEIASMENTINYEVVCNVGKRVPRVYIKHGEIIKTVNMILF